jgi:uncharacterized membrane protein YeaQ/YmgE (transglycosylase-associated protein family)
MNFVLWLLMGAALGWVASVINRTPALGPEDTEPNSGLLINVVVGIVGATVGAWLLTPMMGMGTVTLDQFNLGSLAVALGGAVVLLAVVSVVRSLNAR